ncbi:hypothetical protein HYU07_07915, partial [Candidatus Woesearchaeota archaeon]|nr:hypothetical protein [Candidatus Woesearchaeota archaeon]
AVKLHCPESLSKEVEEHKSRIKILSNLPSTELDLLLKKLKEKIKSFSLSEYEKFLKQANSLISDKEDTEYLALSLALNKMPIWSNDPHFKKQSIVEVFNTKELVDKLKSRGHKFPNSAFL